ncbi:hypothetical protein FJT64_008487 [Amphibalanus amphitrite]|uniref:Uncharacterized protein n=1 Tax=Amphibalanus amphitrite TaxID=1232801 RepID=A0A6A4VIE2_AMPAM|nr:hypothetical protein FJT64_008487 [Amphibalanus amphitrite]
MFTFSVLAALLVASASVQAASPFSSGMELCGHQPCLPPDRCQDVDGVSVCIAGLPCYPKPYCIRTSQQCCEDE